MKDRTVCIWPDNDEPGRRFADRVAQLCRDAGAACVHVVDVPEGFPEKWDLADAMPEGWDVQTLENLLAAKPPPGAAKDLGLPSSPFGDGTAPATDNRSGPQDVLGDLVLDGRAAASAATETVGNDDSKVATDVECIENEAGAGGESSPTDEQTLSELAGLSPVEYDRCRVKEAKSLGIRASTLDQVIARRRPPDASADDGAGSTLLFEEYEPWPEPVNGGELLERLRSSVSRYAIMPAGSEIAIPLWVLFAHTHNYHSVSPILGIFAPDSECGKTTVLNWVSRAVPKALPSSGASPATVYRVIEDCQPTLLIDELDSLPRETADALRGIYDSGHTRRFAYIMRMVKAGDDMEVRRFSTWAPKAIAQIGKPATTILSRSIVIWMQRKKPGQDIDKLPIDGTPELVELHRKCLRWAADHGQQLLNAAPNLPSSMGNRLADNWTPLFAIADLIGGPWPEQARDAAAKLSGVGSDDTSKGIQVLRDIREILNKRDTNRIGSQELCDALHEHDDKWAEYSRGKSLSPGQLSRLLKPYGIRPKSQRMDAERNVKGYALKSFSEAFDRYLPPGPPSGNVTTSQPKHTAPLGDSQTVTSPSDVTDGNGRKAAEPFTCDVVTDEIPLPQGEGANDGLWEEDL